MLHTNETNSFLNCFSYRTREEISPFANLLNYFEEWYQSYEFKSRCFSGDILELHQ